MTESTSAIRAPSPDLVREASAETGIPETFIEKDWYAIQVLRVLATHGYHGHQPIFSGGTSLSKGWGLIHRFSEDIDFKIRTATPPSRPDKRIYRAATIELLKEVDGIRVDEGSLASTNASNTFKFCIQYPQVHSGHIALRPHLQVEMSFHNPTLPSEERPLRSFIAELGRLEPEARIHCVSPIETAADKYSALVWRVLSKDRTKDFGHTLNEPEMIRHLHDLCALEAHATTSPEFSRLVVASYDGDKARGGLAGRYSLEEASQQAVKVLTEDDLYQQEYEQFVGGMSYAREEERIGFEAAMAAFVRIIKVVV